jgi:hypothetical protein
VFYFLAVRFKFYFPPKEMTLVAPYYCIYKLAKFDNIPKCVGTNLPESCLSTLQSFIFNTTFNAQTIEEEPQVNELPSTFFADCASSIFYESISRSDVYEYYVICFIAKGADNNTLYRYLYVCVDDLLLI